jgi:hypothetical protein
MTDYRQDQRLPWNPAGNISLLQPGNNRLAASYSFERGASKGPSFAPNSMTLPPGWTTWNFGATLIASPWLDAARREAVLGMVQTGAPAQGDGFGWGGFIRAAPALDDYYMVARVGFYGIAQPAVTPGDLDTPPYQCGLVISDDADFLEDGTHAFLAAGSAAAAQDGLMQPVMQVAKYGDINSAPASAQFVYAYSGYVRWHIHNAPGPAFALAEFSVDGSHWTSQGAYVGLTGIKFFGFGGTCFQSTDDPDIEMPAYYCCSDIAIYEPIANDPTNEALTGAGGSQILG